MQGKSPDKEPQNGQKMLRLRQMDPEQQKNYRFIMKYAQSDSFILKQFIILSNPKSPKKVQFAMTIKAKTLPNPENREKTKQKANLARNLLQGGRNIKNPKWAIFFKQWAKQRTPAKMR